MKSKLFTDMQGLDSAPRLNGRVSVCLLMDRRACECMLQEAQRLGLTTGEYVERLVLARLPREKQH